MGISDEQKKLVQSTASMLKDNGKEITEKFYGNLFREHPEFRDIFNQTNQKTGKQPVALAQTFLCVIQNFDNLDAVMPQLRRISNKHRAIQVRPEHYPIVGKYLMAAVRENLGGRATPEMMNAWQAAYDVVASAFMNIEKDLYNKLGDDERNRRFIPYKIVKKETIASGPIVALTVAREDGGKLVSYSPGQYLTLRIEKDGVLHNGHYSLTEPFNGKSYTVAFKKGDNIDQNSVVSNEIISNRDVGNKILVSPPSGTFGLAKDAKNHLFISGGIGIAPFAAMIQELSEQGNADSVQLIQCVRTQDAAAFADKLRSLLPKDRYTVFTQDHILSKSDLQGKLNADTHVYLCGSDLFLNIAENALRDFGHPDSQMHVESIEPSLRLLRGCLKQ